MLIPGTAYGVGKSLIEEGIFSIQATPLGPNLCLLEEQVEGDLALILKEGVDWKTSLFQEVRRWKYSDVECYRAPRMSIYGIPCYVRNKNFLEVLLADIGVCPAWDFLQSKLNRLDVLSMLIFTRNLDMIRSKVTVCLDGR